MTQHRFNGTFEYEPEYSCSEEDLEGVRNVFTDVTSITPIVDLTLGDARVVLVSVQQHRSNDKVCLILNAEDGTKYFYEPKYDVPSSEEELAASMNEWSTCGDSVKKRSNLWKEANYVKNNPDVAEYKTEPDPIIQLVGEENVGDGMVELEFEYGEDLVYEVAKHYNVDPEDVSKRLISDFVTVAIYKGVNETDHV